MVDVNCGLIQNIFSSNALEHIEWLKKVFHAEVEELYQHPESKIVNHCSLKFNGGRFFMADAACMPELKGKTPDDLAYQVFVSSLESDDLENIFQRAVENGAKVSLKPEEQFWGEVHCIFADPFNFRWNVYRKV